MTTFGDVFSFFEIDRWYMLLVGELRLVVSVNMVKKVTEKASLEAINLLLFRREGRFFFANSGVNVPHNKHWIGNASLSFFNFRFRTPLSSRHTSSPISSTLTYSEHQSRVNSEILKKWRTIIGMKANIQNPQSIFISGRDSQTESLD
ncbi:hypothetical protein TNCV_2785071 [Trichonephila clavipes]|nr:hypothetical protein TNCV_2785071 [Trichonephila clavipes]